MNRRIWTGIWAALGMLVLILDAKNAVMGAAEGISLCLHSVIPSLFPFFVLSVLLTGALTGVPMPLLAPLGRLCGIPRGGESLLITGLLGGYPTGAQGVRQAWQSGCLSREEAQRLLGFCSNAGPSFLFGILASQFSQGYILWALWAIHILSAVLTGILLPGKHHGSARLPLTNAPTLPQALRRSLRITAGVCGWVILFRILLAILNRWCLWLLPDWVQVAFCGALELTNGCCDLSRIADESLRFVVCAGLLSLGGICVLMQTASVTGELGLGMYIPGKLLQCALSLNLSVLALPALFGSQLPGFPPIFLAFAAFLLIAIFLARKPQNRSSIPAQIGV